MKLLPQMSTIPSCYHFHSLTPNSITSTTTRQQQKCATRPNERRLSNGYGGPSHQQPPQRRRKIKLMEFPEIVYPTFMTHPLMFFRNKFFAFLISGYFDDTFSQKGFLEGGELAVKIVSSLISEGSFDELDGLVHSSALPEIRQNYEQLDMKERNWIKVDPDDIFNRFIYQIGVMMPDDGSEKRYVEITAVFRGCHGLGSTDEPPLRYMYERLHENFICNYRFIREFTKGVEDHWVINKVNHFNIALPV